MTDAMHRIREAAGAAALGPLADARQRPSFPRVAAQSPFPPEAGREDYLARFRAEMEALTAKAYGPFDAEGVAGKVAELILHSTLNSQPLKVLSWSEDEIGVPGLAARLKRASVEMVMGAVPNNEYHQQVLERLAALEVGLTGAIAGLADTGSIVVASGAGRGRVASLLPPVHIAVLPVDRLFPTMQDWLAAEGAELVRGTANLVVITGSSRTSDIELQTTLGMHGPKELHVVLYEPSAEVCNSPNG